MKSNFLIAIAIAVLLIIGAVFYFAHSTALAPASQEATSTPVSSTALTTITPAGLSFTHDEPYGLATNPQQILVKSYIPSCMGPFDYCIYYNGNAYAGTNFESAGIAIRKRADLNAKNACLTEPPMGYAGQHATTTEANGYATSVSGPLGNAATGHYSTGYQYRLWYGTTCYEFTTQIGESQIANYPAGTKTEFTSSDRARVMSELQGILASVRANGTPVVFPH